MEIVFFLSKTVARKIIVNHLIIESWFRRGEAKKFAKKFAIELEIFADGYALGARLQSCRNCNTPT
jgi:hypothetical protein